MNLFNISQSRKERYINISLDLGEAGASLLFQHSGDRGKRISGDQGSLVDEESSRTARET